MTVDAKLDLIILYCIGSILATSHIVTNLVECSSRSIGLVSLPQCMSTISTDIAYTMTSLVDSTNFALYISIHTNTKTNTESLHEFV